VLDATPADLPAVATTLARAFHDDPVFEVLFGAPIPEARARRLFRTLGTITLRKPSGLVQRTSDDEGATMWAPPGAWETPATEILRSAPNMVRSFGRRTINALKVLSVLETHHPKEHHWYLEFIGTDPAHQGKGVGSALLQPMVDRFDEEGVPAYLESSKEANLAFYGRFGFEVTERITLPGGVHEWLMWRDPR
jgi:ribosomal protein S18 acetylase RimI-like enzyme